MRGIDDALEHIVFLANKFSDANERFVVKVLLLETGVPTNMEGFSQLQDAILYRMWNPAAQLTKEIYPALAKERGIYCRPKHVEGVIRSAVKSAWKKRDHIWLSYFPDGRCPSNGEFISRMAAMVELWRECVTLEIERRSSDERSSKTFC